MTSVIFDEYGHQLVVSRVAGKRMSAIAEKLAVCLFDRHAVLVNEGRWIELLDKLRGFMDQNFATSRRYVMPPIIRSGHNTTMGLLRYFYENPEYVRKRLLPSPDLDDDKIKHVAEQVFYLMYMQAKLLKPKGLAFDQKSGHRIWLDIRAADLLVMLADLISFYSEDGGYQFRLDELILGHVGKEVYGGSQLLSASDVKALKRYSLHRILSVNPKLIFHSLPPREEFSWVYDFPIYRDHMSEKVDDLIIRQPDEMPEYPPIKYTHLEGKIKFEIVSEELDVVKAERLLRSLAVFNTREDLPLFTPRSFALDLSRVDLSSYDGDRGGFFTQLLSIENSSRMSRLSLAGLVQDEEVEKLQVALSERARQHGSLKELYLSGCQFKATSQQILCEILEECAPLSLVLSEQDEKGEAWKRLQELNQSNVVEQKVRSELLKLTGNVTCLLQDRLIVDGATKVLEDFRNLFCDISKLFQSVEKICDSRRNFFIREVCEQLNTLTQSFVDYCNGKDKNDEEFQKVEKLQKFISSLTPLIAQVISAYNSGDDEVKGQVQRTLLLLFTALLKVVIRQGYEVFVGDSGILRKLNEMDSLATDEFENLQVLYTQVKTFSDCYDSAYLANPINCKTVAVLRATKMLEQLAPFATLPAYTVEDKVRMSPAQRALQEAAAETARREREDQKRAEAERETGEEIVRRRGLSLEQLVGGGGAAAVVVRDEEAQRRSLIVDAPVADEGGGGGGADRGYVPSAPQLRDDEEALVEDATGRKGVVQFDQLDDAAAAATRQGEAYIDHVAAAAARDEAETQAAILATQRERLHAGVVGAAEYAQVEPSALPLEPAPETAEQIATRLAAENEQLRREREAMAARLAALEAAAAQQRTQPRQVAAAAGAPPAFGVLPDAPQHELPELPPEYDAAARGGGRRARGRVRELVR